MVVAVGRPAHLRLLSRAYVPSRGGLARCDEVSTAAGSSLEVSTGRRSRDPPCVRQPRTAQQANGPTGGSVETIERLPSTLGPRSAAWYGPSGAVPAPRNERRTDNGCRQVADVDTDAKQPQRPAPALRRQSRTASCHRTGHRDAPADAARPHPDRFRVWFGVGAGRCCAMVRACRDGRLGPRPAGDPIGHRHPRSTVGIPNPIHAEDGASSAGYAGALVAVCAPTGGWPRRSSRCSDPAGSWMAGPT